jgi:hypothetical protein
MMRAIASRLRGFRLGTIYGTTLVVVVWAVLLLGVAVPSWRDVRERHAEIDRLETQLADLDRWTVAGLWLEPVVARREPQIAARWSRVFPAERAREELFLQVAAAADRCRLREFQLEEIDDYDMLDAGTWSTDDQPVDDGPSTDDAPPTDVPAGAPELAPVAITLTSYRVRAAFTGDYARTADFLAELDRLERALEVRHLAIRPARTGIMVELELEVPVSEPTAA